MDMVLATAPVATGCLRAPPLLSRPCVTENAGQETEEGSPGNCLISLIKENNNNNDNCNSKSVSNGVKGLRLHSYYDCCINVHVSSLLEHWLDWDRTSPTYNNNANKRSTSGHNHINNNPELPSCEPEITAKSLSLSPFCFCQSSQLLRPPVVTKMTSTEDEGIISSGDELEESWIRDIFHAIGCDDCAEGEDWWRDGLTSGNAILEHIFQGHGNLDGTSLVKATQALLDAGLLKPQKSLTGPMNNTPLLAIQHLLERGLFQVASEVAAILLPSSDVNHINKCNRTLLSYAVSHGDQAIDLIRMLMNSGAKVWPLNHNQQGDEERKDVVRQVGLEREQSAFTWFLRSVMGQGPVWFWENCQETLYLLGDVMGEEPARMKCHVTRTMLQLGKGALINGPLFLQIKTALMSYWASPQDLRYQCVKKVRKILGPKRLGPRSVSGLPLPKKLQKYVRLEEMRPGQRRMRYQGEPTMANNTYQVQTNSQVTSEAMTSAQ